MCALKEFARITVQDAMAVIAVMGGLWTAAAHPGMLRSSPIALDELLTCRCPETEGDFPLIVA